MSHTTDSPTGIDAQRFAEPAARVEAYMRQYLDERPLPANLRDAIAYSLLGPGKRMRPILVIRSCEAVGGDLEAAMPPAAAIEMIHCFSLVHDDLPAMDDDDLRRGRPTLHRHTDEAMAILAGDAMMGLAFELLSNRVTPADRAVAMIRELTIGTDNMIAGQVYDTRPQFDAAMPAAERLETIHRNKTGALFRAAVRMGALAGGAGDAQLDSLSDYAGKTAGKDAEQDKLTYVAVHGIESSRRQVDQLRDAAHAALRQFGERARPLDDLCDFLAVRTK